MGLCDMQTVCNFKSRFEGLVDVETWIMFGFMGHIQSNWANLMT